MRKEVTGVFRWLGIAGLFWCLSFVPSARAAQGTHVPSEVQCKDLVTTLCHLMAAGNANAFIDAVDTDALIDRALVGVPGAEAVKSADRKVMSSEYLGSIRQVIGTFKEFEYVRFRLEKGEAQTLIRLVTKDGDFNFWYLTLAFTGNSQPRIVDIYYVSSGENTSQLLHRNLVLALADSNRSIFEKLTGEPSDFIKYKDTWLAFMDAAKRKDHNALEAQYHKLPASLRSQKIIQIAHIQSVGQSNPSAMPAEVERFRGLFPNDPSLPYLQYNAYAAGQKYEEAMAPLDELEKALGKDPFFEFQRAMVYTLMKQPDKAIEHAREGIPQVRAYDAATRFYLLLLAGQKKYADAVTLLRELERDTGKEMYSQIYNSSTYSGLIHSPEFAQWMQSPVKKQVDAPLLKRFEAMRSSTPASSPATGTPARTAPAAAAAVPKAPVAPYVLKGIFFSKKNPSALINSKTVFIGEKVDEAVVVKIEETSVTLDIKGKTEVLSLK